jgi:hypothetical protein
VSVGAVDTAAKQWQMKFLPCCSSLCLSSIFDNLSVKDRFPLDIKGWSRPCGAGVFAACDIPYGAVVCSYLGEVVTDLDMSLREALHVERNHTIDLEAYYKCWKHLKLKGRHSLIDAHSCGNAGRLLNRIACHN